MSLPFPHWDPDLLEWLDDSGHIFEVRFQDVPDHKASRRLGRLFTEHFLHGPADPSGWTWSGPFARFDVTLRCPRDHAAVFAHVAEFLIQAHEIALIKEVLMLDGALPPAESLDKGPAFEPRIRRVDRRLPAPAPNRAFLGGWRQVQDQLKLAAEQEQAARLESLFSSPKPDQVGLSRVEAVPLSSQQEYPACLRELFDPAKTFFRGPLSAPYVILKNNRQYQTYSWLDGGRVREASFPEPVCNWSAPRSDGRFALVWLHTSNKLFEIDLTSGETALLWTGDFQSDGAIQGVHYLDNDTWAVSFEKLMYVLRRSKKEIREVTRGPAMGSSMVIVAQGRLLISAGLQVHLWTGERLKLVGQCDAKKLGFHAEKGDEILLRIDPSDLSHFLDFYAEDRHCDARTFFALTQVEEVLKAREAKPKKTARKRQARPKITLEPVPEGDVPPRPEISGKDRVLVTKKRRSYSTVLDGLSRQRDTVVQAESGRIAAIVGEGITFLDDARQQQLVPDERRNEFKHIVLDPDGTCAFVQVGNHTLHQADFQSRAIREVAFIGLNCGVLADFAALDADNVLMLGERKLLWMMRLDGEWLPVDEKKISGGQNIHWSPSLRVAIVLTKARDALQVWAPLDEQLTKLGQLREKIREVRIHGDAVYALWPEQAQSFLLTHVAEVREIRESQARKADG